MECHRSSREIYGTFKKTDETQTKSVKFAEIDAIEKAERNSARFNGQNQARSQATPDALGVGDVLANRLPHSYACTRTHTHMKTQIDTHAHVHVCNGCAISQGSRAESNSDRAVSSRAFDHRAAPAPSRSSGAQDPCRAALRWVVASEHLTRPVARVIRISWMLRRWAAAVWRLLYWRVSADASETRECAYASRLHYIGGGNTAEH